MGGGWPIDPVWKLAPPILAARDLSIEDQISLLKGATFELCQLRFNTVFNAETGTWECGRLSYCLEDTAGARQTPAPRAEGGKDSPGGGEEPHQDLGIWNQDLGEGKSGSAS